MTTSILWFRQDLRLLDNPALIAACESGELIPIYIQDTSVPVSAILGGASKWCLHHALSSLNKALDGKLQCFSGDPKVIIENLCEQYAVSHVFWNRMYESWARERDAVIKVALKAKDIKATSFNGSLLWEPMQVLKKDQTPYKVYTPYYRRGCLSKQHPRYPQAKPTINLYAKTTHSLGFNGIDDLDLLPKIDWDSGIKIRWDISEKGAQDKLSCFINEAIIEYNDDRNVPSIKGTSLLSPYLHFGLISPNQAWYAVLDAFDGSSEKKGVDVYLSELGWREFSYYLLYHFPHIPHKNFSTKFENFPWREDPIGLQAWQNGKTGIPIVDAGMRELYETGYMHNRVRMIVGSFLVKNLLIDWREGERWFWDCLLDADTASNAAGWQWVAGTGADASPYFRVFNPLLQGEKFDKEGVYVKQYCPELSKLPKKYIHQPWNAPDEVLQAANITLGNQYPKPLVDLKTSRLRALDAFAETKKG